MSDSLYIEVNLLCLMVIVILLCVSWKGVAREKEQRVFSGLCVHGIILFLLDVAWKLCDGKSFTGAYYLNNFVNAAYFIQCGIVAYFWLQYSLYLDGGRSIGRGWKRTLVFLPIILLAVLSIVSIWTHWIFVVDETNHYIRGPLMWTQVLLSFSYLFYLFVWAAVRAVQKRNFVNRNRFIALSALGIIPLVAEIIQLSMPGTAVFCVGATFGVLVMFVENQEQRISLDPLTKLNNKLQFYSYLDSKMKARLRLKGLVVFIFDLDSFKLLNDKFGYVEGDRILLTISYILKNIFGSRGDFIARYGGDEFVVVSDVRDSVEAFELRSQFYEQFWQKTAKLQYVMSVSVGFAEFESHYAEVPDFMDVVYKDLNREKMKNRKMRRE